MPNEPKTTLSHTNTLEIRTTTKRWIWVLVLTIFFSVRQSTCIRSTFAFWMRWTPRFIRVYFSTVTWCWLELKVSSRTNLFFGGSGLQANLAVSRPLFNIFFVKYLFYLTSNLAFSLTFWIVSIWNIGAFLFEQMQEFTHHTCRSAHNEMCVLNISHFCLTINNWNCFEKRIQSDDRRKTEEILSIGWPLGAH